MSYPVSLTKEDRRLIFGVLTFSGSIAMALLAVAVPSAAPIVGDLAKIFGVGFVSALSFYFGGKKD